MTVYSYNTIGVFPSIIRTASEGLGSFSYVYEPSIIDLFIEIDYGTLAFDTTPVTTTTTVLVDDLNATLTNTILSDTGTGTGTTGGFNIGRHIRFNSTNKPRTVEFSLPNDINSSLTFEVIRGSDNNGGEDPDTVAESLNLEYYDGSSWTSIDTVVAHNDTTFNTLKSVEITIPSVARTAGTQFRLIQPDHSGNDWDHYGLKSVTYTHTSTPVLSTKDLGSITDLNATIEDRGRIFYVTNVESFGFAKTLNAASWKATSAWVGEGSLISFGRQTSPAVYGYITDGKVRSLQGTADVEFTAVDGGSGFFPLQGSAIIGITADIIGSGRFTTLSGSAESVAVNPDERQILFSFTGQRSSERTTNIYNGVGTLSNLASLEEDRGFAWYGSGVITVQSDETDERKTDNYNHTSIVPWSTRDFGNITQCNAQEIVSGDLSGQAATGCTIVVEPNTTARVVLGQTYQTAQDVNYPSTFIDWGTITFPAAMSQDWGNILDRELRPQGLIRFDEENGAASIFQPNWVGRGGLRLRGKATLPVFANEKGTGILHEIRGVAITNFSLLQPGDGLFKFVSDASSSTGVEAFGSGSFKKFGGAAESSSFNPLEEQILFSFGGAYSNLKFTHGTWIGSGRINNIASLEAEKGTFDYVGSGEINIISRKPVWPEDSDEKHTEAYNFSAFVPSIDLDYGLIVDITNVVVTELTTQTISTDTTAPTGVIRVGLNETVTLSAVYNVPNTTSVPTITDDYGLVSEVHDPTTDYGWILGTHAHGIPFGTVADITGSSENPRTRTYIADGDGLFKITGKARLPLFASVFGGGLFKPQGASITNFSLLAIGDGHINGMSGEGAESTVTEYYGDGAFRKLSGAAESASFNPLERQMLFSFNGAVQNLAFAHGTFGGDGVLFTFEGGGERTSFDYVGSGSILTFNKLEEARTYFYNCSSIVPFLDIDYGLIVDQANAAVTDLTTQTISSDEIAATGSVRIGLNEVVTLGAVYTVPNQVTTPTTFIDYNIVNETEDELLDHGHILDSVQVGMPGCIYGTVEVRGVADIAFTPNNISRGELQLRGEARIFSILRNIGEGTLFAISGASSSSGVAYESTGLFQTLGFAEVALVREYAGSGAFRKLSGAAESITFNPLEKQMLFSFTGTAGIPSITLSHTGDGNLFTFDGTTDSTTFAHYGSGVISLRSKKPRPDVDSEEKHTEVYDLNIDCIQPEYDYGSLIDAALSQCTPTSGLINATITAPTGCIVVDGTLGIYPNVTYTVPVAVNSPTTLFDYGTVPDPEDGTDDYGWILDPTGKHCPFGQIHHIRGTSGPGVRTFREVFTGESEHKVYGINISGDAEIVVPPQWYGYGVLDVTSRPISTTGFSLRTFGGGNLFGIGGGAESVTFVPSGGQVLFKFVPGPFDRWTTYDWQPSWQGRGAITLPDGEAVTRYVPHVIGTGNIPVFSGAAESLTVNPEERQLLFSFTGEGQEAFVANPPERTVHISFNNRGFTTGIFFIPHYPGDGLISVSGDANIHYVPHVVGTGSIPVFNGAAESSTFNPEERQMLFSFIGERLSEKKSVAEIGFGDILFSGTSGDPLLTFAEQPFGTVPVSGEAHIVASLLHVGSGTFRKLGGAAESATFNPQERDLLFSFTGERIAESTSFSEVASGTLFGFSGASETFAFAYETQGLFRVADEALVVASLLHVGSGTIRKFAGAAESLTVNPDERQILFSFTGEGSQSLTVAETKQVEIDITGKADPVLRTQAFHGSGTFTVTGEVGVKYVPNNVGFGNIFAINGAAESITFNPDEKQMLFSFLGEVTDSITVREISKGGTLTFAGTSGDPLLSFAESGFGQTKLRGKVRFTTHRSIFGTGFFRKFGGSAEAVAFNPVERDALFRFVGDATHKITSVYIGSGSLRKLSGAAEAVAFNPDERQMLFSFAGDGADSRTAREVSQGGTLKTSGTAKVLVSFAHAGEGTIPLSGDARTTRARDFVGFGSIPVFRGAAESLTFNPTEREILFSFNGERISEKTTARELSQGGTLLVGSELEAIRLTFSEQPHIEIAVNGDSVDLRAFAYQGSGRISNVNNVEDAFVRAPWQASGTVKVTGDALIQVQLFQPEFVQVWII